MKALQTLVIALAMLGFGSARAQAPERGTPPAPGKQIYDYWCLPCHGPGVGMPGFDALPGTQQLKIKYRGTSTSPLLEERTDLVPDFVKTIVRQGVSFMPQFRKTEISDADLDALAAYLSRNSKAAR